MGIIDNKREIFTQIAAFTSVKDDQELSNLIGSIKDSIPSVNNSKEIIPLLLDLLVVLVGSEQLTTLVGGLMTDFIRKIEPTLKEELKKQMIEFNSDQIIPPSFVNGINIAATTIDTYEKLKTDPASQTGSLLYNNDVVDFDRKSYIAIQNAGTDIIFNNVKMNYNKTTNEFIYKPTNTSQTIGEYTSDYIDGLTIINEKEFSSDIVNIIFGTINTNQDKTQAQLILEEKLDKSIQKLIHEEESIAITDEELRQIELEAQKRKDGIQTVDVGCGVLINTVTIDSLENLISITTGSTDPLTVGNAYVDLIAGGFDPADETQAKEDGETIKDGFLKKLINAIVGKLVASIITPPQIRTLLGITSAFKNNGIPDIGNPLDDLINKRKLMDCLSKKAKSIINEYIFNLLKIHMMNLIIPVSKLILKEKINQYLNILKSLIGFVNKI